MKRKEATQTMYDAHRLISTYRKQLVVLKNSERYMYTIDFISVLDDEYIRSIPLDEYLVVFFLGMNSRYANSIIKTTRITNLDDDRTPCLVHGVLHGSDNPQLIDTSYSISWSMSSTRIISYKLLDISEAPLFINWYLTSSMKGMLFRV
jgi:hypothetical protein